MLVYKQLLVALAILSVSLLSIRGTSLIAKQLGEHMNMHQAANGMMTSNSTNVNATLLHERMIQNGMPENPRMYFIHVGKAGGLSLYKTMDLPSKLAALPCRINRTRDGEDDESCYEPKTIQSSEFNKHVIGHFHMLGGYTTEEQKQWLLNNTNIFLYVVRDPMDRIISAYNYHKNYFVGKHSRRGHRAEQQFYQKCFPNGVNTMMDSMRFNANTEPCKRTGEKVVKGSNGGGSHFAFNYQHYKQFTLGSKPNHSVAVIRTEYMWEDVTNLDIALGGTGNVNGIGTKFTHGSEKLPYSSNLTVANTIHLCCLLRLEIEVYHTLVLKAFNLEGYEKNQTLSSLLTHCHVAGSGKERDEWVKDPSLWRKRYGRIRNCAGTN